MNASSARRAQAAAPRPASPSRHAGGFTLIEVLLATVLLAAGLAIAFATLRAATDIATRGETLAARNERMRAVEGFLRARLTATRPIPFGFDQERGVAIRFLGEPDRMRFVADLPDYLGRGGPYLHDFTVVREGDALRLQVALTMVLGGEPVAEQPPRGPEPLADGLRAVRFRYRALDADGRLGPWQERWQIPDALPLQVEATITGRDGRDWPPLVVALPLAGSYGGVSP